MPKAIVDPLQIVEVDGDESEGQTVRQPRERALELAPVGELGERVGQRLLLEQLMGRGVLERQLGDAREQLEPGEEARLDRDAPAGCVEDAGDLTANSHGDVRTVRDLELREVGAHLRPARRRGRSVR